MMSFMFEFINTNNLSNNIIYLLFYQRNKSDLEKKNLKLFFIIIFFKCIIQSLTLNLQQKLFLKILLQFCIFR